MSERHFHTIEEIEQAVHRPVRLPVVRASTPALKRAVFFTAGPIIFLVLALPFVPWTQSVFGKGSVIAYSPEERPQPIEAPVEGRIHRWLVQEGSRVEKDQPLVELVDVDPLILERLASEKDAVERRIIALEQSITTSRKNVDRQRELARKGLASQRSFELSSLEEAKFAADLAAAQIELARLLVRISRQSSQTIKASRPGLIARILAPQGGILVKAGDKLAHLVPETKDRAVELFVSGNDVALLAIGRPVRLQFEGWPAVQFAGWPSVAVGSFPGRVGLIDPTDDGTGRFRALIFPEEEAAWPSSQYLRLGVRAHGWILLDDVSLAWELWRLFNGFPQTTSEPK